MRVEDLILVMYPESSKLYMPALIDKKDCSLLDVFGMFKQGFRETMPLCPGLKHKVCEFVSRDPIVGFDRNHGMRVAILSVLSERIDVPNPKLTLS